MKSEERVAEELKSLGKPFAIVLNSSAPESESARNLAVELEEKYGVPVALVNLTMLNRDDIREILALVLGQFPVRSLEFSMPEWTEALDSDHPLKREMFENIKSIAEKTRKLGDLTQSLQKRTLLF